MKKYTGMLVALFAIGAGFTGAAAQDKDKDKPKNERAVIITGCVTRGSDLDTFMLHDVKQVGASGAMVSVPKDRSGQPILYWLNSTEGLSERIGKRVEVAGVVDFNDTHKGQTKVTVDPSKTKDTKVEISSGDKEVKMKVDTNPNVPKIEGAAKTTTIPAQPWVYDLHVETVKTIPGDCPIIK